MKKITLLFALILSFGALTKAQTCSFTYSQDPGSNTVTYQAPSGFNGMLYFFSWQFSNSNSYLFGSTVSQTYNQSTTETVVLDIYGPDSTIICSSTQTIQISVSAPPCSFSYNQTASGSYVFALNQTGSNIQVSWSFGDGTSGSGSVVEHTYLNNGTYMVTMTVIVNGDACTSTMAVSVFNNNPNDSTVCSFDYYSNVTGINTNLAFYTTGGSPSASYSWNFGDGTTGTGSQLVHQFPGAGTYTVCLTVGANGAVVCENCMDVVVGNTNPTPSDCEANFTYSSSDLTAFFINQSANSYVNTNTTYYWSFGDGQYSSSPFPYHTYGQAGEYNVCLMVTQGTCFDSICQLVTVSEISSPSDSCSAYFVISQQSPFSVDVVNMSNGSSYVWSIAGISNTSNFPVITVPFTGSYILCLTVTNANGCVATYCDSLTIDSTGIVQRNAQSEFTINVVSPAQITGFSPTSIKTISATNNEIFPNPFSNSFTINNPNSEKLNYEMFSVDGKVVKQGIITNKVETINAENLTSGLYMLSLINSKGERSVTKINKN